MNNTSTTKPLLAFHGVTHEHSDYDGSLAGVDLALHEGDLMLIRIERGHADVPFADVAQGVALPYEGRVEIFGQDWQDLPPDEVVAFRSQIGRVFERVAWVSNLDVDENITLAERHVSEREPSEIFAEALGLAKAFGLEEIPAKRPAWVKGSELRRLQWVRVFLGKPKLILLERATRDVYAKAIPALFDQVAEACKRGAGVLWITSDEAIWEQTHVPHAKRTILAGGRLESAS